MVLAVEENYFSFTAGNKTGDFHGGVNAEVFIRGMMSQLLPSLREPSVIVMDKPYHSQQTEDSRCPT